MGPSYVRGKKSKQFHEDEKPEGKGNVLSKQRLDTPQNMDGSVSAQSYPYFEPKAAPLNDLHPPIVSKNPPSRDAAKWMTAPPPTASKMNRAMRDGSIDEDV